MVCLEGSPLALAGPVCSAYLRQCADKICRGRNRRQETDASRCNASDREEFEELIGFLAAVPLFQKQLPPAELPKVATALQVKKWAPGEKLIEQGKDGKEFFIIRAGEASVVVKSTDGEFVRATLYYGDYFGGHTLTQKRPNIATIVSKGPMELVTLSMSREDFEKLELHKELVFPKRPAIYDGRIIEDGQKMDDLEGASPGNRNSLDLDDLADGEVAFISKVIRENHNLRARCSFDQEAAKNLARSAQRRFIAKDTDIAVGGELAAEFFVISKGSFKLIPRVQVSHQSVEAMVATSAATERLGRKQQFLMGLVRSGASSKSLGRTLEGKPKSVPTKDRRTQSMRVPNVPGAATVMRRHSQMVSAQVKKSPFKPGDTVARLRVGDGPVSRAVGQVVEINVPGQLGEVTVEFPEPLGKQRVQVRYLRPVEDARPIATLQCGDCCGEVELLYNTRQMATSRALEDSEVYAIPQKVFREYFQREAPHFKDTCNLLDSVQMLTPLLIAERKELARNCAAVLCFKPGERVIQQDDANAAKMWYVIGKGSCSAKKEKVDVLGNKTVEELREYHRADHFGEDLIVGSSNGKSKVPEFSIDAGSEGMTCYAFDGELLKNLLLSGDDDDEVFFEFNSRARKTTHLSSVSLENLNKIALLGEGGFGSVYLVRHEEKEYALKRMSKGYVVQAKVAKQIQAERDIFSMVDNPFIVHFFRSYQDEQYVYMLMEFASGGHLWGMMSDNWDILQKDNPRGSSTMFYVACVSLAFDHLHERHIVYRDLKPENILLDSRGYAKICDLGFARFVLTKTNTLVGTPEYMAPEMIDTPHAHDKMVDWWALGVLAFELITGQVPWDDQAACDTMAQILTIRRGQETGIPEHLLPSGSILIKDFIKKLTCANEEQRMGTKRGGAEVREHPWFAYAAFDFAALQEGTLRSPWTPAHKVVEKKLPDDWKDSDDSSLFVHYKPDGSGWEQHF